MTHPKEIYATREDWLQAAYMYLTQSFVAAGIDPEYDVRISCGFPYGSRGGSKEIKAQTWPKSASKDQHIEIFIPPTIDKGLIVLKALVPEMIHAAIGPEFKHNQAYKEACRRLGLKGTATTPIINDGSTRMHSAVHDVLKKCGTYPHSKIEYTTRKKATTRMIKAECNECGFIFRTTKKWVEKAENNMVCPDIQCGGRMSTDQ